MFRRPRHLARERFTTTALAALACGACTSAGEEEPYVAVADVQELMFHVVEPAAQEYWAAVGWILDHEGEHYFRPESDEEWLAVENAAFMVAEAGNLLMMPERTLDDAGWIAMSQSLVDVGRRALEVAEAQDEQGVFDLGAEMYFVCSACHAAYSPEILRPNDERAAPEGGEGATEAESPPSGGA
jgi:hypothetical protein